MAIIGTGAMGSLFAALLSPHAEIVMIGRWAAALRAVVDPGLILQHLDGSESRHVVSATSQVASVTPCEVALIVVKGWQTGDAAKLARAVLQEDGLAVTLQNGLGSLETIAEVIGASRAVQGVTSEGATLLGPGHVRHAGRGHTHFAATETSLSQLQETAALFEIAGLKASLVDDAQSLIWGKLAVNAGINPLTALLQVPNGRLVQDDQLLDIMRGAASEVASVAQKLGIPLPYDDAAAQAIQVARATAANRSSMAQDVARGMPTEIEQICGAVVRRGQDVGVPTPVNEALLHLVRTQVAYGAWLNAIDDVPHELQPAFRYLSSLVGSNESDPSD